LDGDVTQSGETNGWIGDRAYLGNESIRSCT
jgi:hypothetical protein